MNTRQCTDEESIAAIRTAIEGRHSVRRFLPDLVSRELVESLLRTASRAATGANMQPWRVHALVGTARERLCRAALDANERFTGDASESRKWDIAHYPESFAEPFLSRRRTLGRDLYRLIGIEKGDRDRMRRQAARNYLFFDAPVGLIFTMHRSCAMGALVDIGMFMQNVMTLARAHGLHTCPQAAWSALPGVVRATLGIGEDQKIVCGMALGYEDPTAPENRLVTQREPVESFACFQGEWL